MNNQQRITKIDENNREEIFTEAYSRSYYTIAGCGGNIEEWIQEYTRLLEETGIGTPVCFITFKGLDMNMYYNLSGNKHIKMTLLLLCFL